MQPRPDTEDCLKFWRRIAALALVVAALGLPVNDLFRYALLVVAGVAICAGELSREARRWLMALAAVVAVCAVHRFAPPPLIEEGHNIFLAEAPGEALEKGLPPAAWRLMREEFDTRYPPGRRCDIRQGGCWRNTGGPDRAYAFSTDGIYDKPLYSRRVTGIHFSNPDWLRLGFVNDHAYNWYADHSDLQRYARVRGAAAVLHPREWTIPYFVMFRFPAGFAGSRLCWQGLVLWEGQGGGYAPLRHAAGACRTLEAGDAGRMIFGVSIGAPLSMTLEATAGVQTRRWLGPALALLGIAAVLILLVRVTPRRLVMPLLLMAPALAVVALHDAAFIGGIRPYDGGDDGLMYEGWARQIVQHLLSGDYVAAMIGGERVFYYGGPGLRYLRAFEHFIFGDTFLGYLTLMLALPLIVFAVSRRFLSARAALAMALMFVAIPVGALFGSTFYQYVKWASRGFADPAAATVFLAGLVVLVGRTADGPGLRFAPAFGTGLLFAIALWLRPNLSPGAAVLLGGAGLAALWRLEIARLAGLCLGFLPVFGMALHNWVFGHALVLFSSNATITQALPMPPSAYVAAAGELLRLDFAGEYVRRWMLQWARWLAGPSESFAMIPLHALAVAVLVRALFAKALDGWLRLTAGAALALHVVPWFYLSYDRYYYLNWLLTLLVCTVWLRDEAMPWLRRKHPQAAQWLERNPARMGTERAMDFWAGVAGLPQAGQAGSVR